MFKRGFRIERSFTTVRNVEHYVTNEVTLGEQIDSAGNVVKTGLGYSSFYSVTNSANVLIEDCIMTGRRQYRLTGTVDLAMTSSCNVLVNRCTQSNFWITVDPVTFEITPSTEYTPGAISSMSFVNVNGTRVRPCWGVMSSNNCKNMEYRNSKLSRFDAHAPITYGKIVNCEVNDIELTGFGDFVIENVKWYPYSHDTPLLFLRSDYGSMWDGKAIIKNVSAYITGENQCYLVEDYCKNFYRGYTCAIPTLDIDNFVCYSLETGEPLVGYDVNVLRSKSYSSEYNSLYKHLPISDKPTIYSVIDEDGDGYIDEPTIDINRDGRVDESDRRDLDGDGKIGNTAMLYADYQGQKSVNIPENLAEELGLNRYANANPIKPPEYIKVINNNGVNGSGGHRFKVLDTSGEGISDGAWWDDEESFGGFFGDTKFIYGEGEGEFFVGTSKEDPSGTFVFEKYDKNC
jgi:hypothetical protein